MNPSSSERRLIAGRSIRWDGERAAAAYETGWWSRETSVDALNRAAAQTPDRILVVDGNVRLDARTLHDRASRLAATLLTRFAPGSVVSFMLPNWVEAVEIYMGATMAGMVAHPLLSSLRDSDLSFILKDVDSRIIFIPGQFRGFDYAAMLSRVAASLDNPPVIAVLRGEAGPHAHYDTLFANAAMSLPALDPDAVRMIMYTSGTTGRPKGVMHSHNSIHALIRQIGLHWRVEPGDTFLVPSPISHIGGSIYAFECPLLLGSRAVLMDKWDADTALGLMHAEACTHMAGATPFLEQLLASAKRAGARLPDLKVFICGGASVSPTLIRAAADAFPMTAVSRVYGSTEVPVTTVGAPSRSDQGHAADTDGKIGIADIRLCDATGALTDGEGEIRALGPQMLVGYHHEEDEEGSFDADGYFRTGDLARRVDHDYLVITGRAKDIIIRNGENISPKEVEDMLAAHPLIREISIVGLPDARTGERACAVIVPAGEGVPDIASLRDFLEQRGVARFKMPEQVELWPGLPKNDAGKVLKQKIRAMMLADGPQHL